MASLKLISLIAFSLKIRFDYHITQIASLPIEVARPIYPLIYTNVAITHQSSITIIVSLKQNIYYFQLTIYYLKLSMYLRISLDNPNVDEGDPVWNSPYRN